VSDGLDVGDRECGELWLQLSEKSLGGSQISRLTLSPRGQLLYLEAGQQELILVAKK